MRSIKISDLAYNFLKKRGMADKRTITSTLDLLVELFMEANYEKKGELEKDCISTKEKAVL